MPHTPKSSQEQSPLIEQEVNKLREGGGGPSEGNTSRELYIHPVPGTKEEWWSETGHQLKKPKHLCSVPRFQDGWHPDPQEPCKMRLTGKGRSKGCLFLNSNQSGPQEIPVLQGEITFQTSNL